MERARVPVTSVNSQTQLLATPPVHYYNCERVGFYPVGVKSILQSSGCEKTSYWARSQAAFMNGVLLFRSKISMSVVNHVVSSIADVYPINDGVKMMGVITIERGNLRGVHVIGDFKDLARFWHDLFVIYITTILCLLQYKILHQNISFMYLLIYLSLLYLYISY